ncbi:histone-lysine N-methyltransferase PRDM9-like isoform X2 [Lepisosteus oculatus]|uniref:histone-lysine N-methyltransferase PRDM9-like isoform X2 n=1 Tax=Lepisosteus oculatus TaxID=7918 RepID=UPI0037188516
MWTGAAAHGAAEEPAVAEEEPSGPVIVRVFDQEWCRSLWGLEEPAGEAAAAAALVPGSAEVKPCAAPERVVDPSDISPSALHAAVRDSQLNIVQVEDDVPGLGASCLYLVPSAPGEGEQEEVGAPLRGREAGAGPAEAEEPGKREPKENGLVRIYTGVCEQLMALNEGDGNLDPGRHAQREAGRNPRCPPACAPAESLSCRSARPGRSAAELGPGADLAAGESIAPVKRAREEALARSAQGPGPVIKRVFDQEWCSSLWSSAQPACESSRVPRPDRRDAAHAGAGVSELRGAAVKQEVDERRGFPTAAPGSHLSLVQVKDERPDLGTAPLYSARAHPAPGERRSLRVKEDVSGLAGGPIKREAVEEELVQVCMNAEDSRPDSRPQAERTPQCARMPASDRRTPGGARVAFERASESVPAQIKPFLRRVRYTVYHGPGAETGCKQELDREEGQGEPTVVVVLQTGAQAPCRTGSGSWPVRQMRTPRMRPLAPLNTPQGAAETRLPTERGAEAGCGAARAGQSEGKRSHSESSEESSTTGGYCLRKKQRVDYSEEPELSDCSGLLDQEGRAKSSAEQTRQAVLSEDKRFQQQSTTSTTSTTSITSTTTSSSTPRENNPQKKRRVHFSELAESDEYFFCPECKFFFFEECEQHGPARFVKDTRAELGLERRARLTLPPGLSLRDSSIPGAGLGVFNVDSLVPRGAHYGPYEGEPTSKEEAMLSGYSWMIYKGKNQVEYIDAKSETSSNWMRFVNCARNEAEQNLVAFQYCGQILFRTCKAISPGCELLVCYGEEYARHLGITWDYIWERKCRPTGESLEVLPCPKCPVTFIAKFHFFKHIKRIHPQEYSRLMTSGSLATQSLEPPKRQQSPAVPEVPSAPTKAQSTEDTRDSHSRKCLDSESQLKRHQQAPIKADDYLFCAECKSSFIKECKQHGPATFIGDTWAEVGLERRARLTLPPGLSLRDSSIPGAGLGVFNVDSLVPRGAHYGPYEGEPTSKEEAMLSGYSWMIYKGMKNIEYIDAKSETSSNWMRFVNCARNEAEQNLVAIQYRGQILFRTCKAISPGCELLVCYGEEYARHLGITWDYIWERKCRPTGESLEEFPCPKCPVTFIAKFHFFKHIKRIHPQEYSRLMTSGSLATQSPEPPKRQQSPAVLEAPSSPAEDQSTEDIPDPLRCSHCGKRFGSERRLKTHQETHRGEGPSPSPSGEERERTYRCAQCGKSFEKLGGLKRHKHAHTAERP